MDDALPVRSLERARDLTRHRDRLLESHAAPTRVR